MCNPSNMSPVIGTLETSKLLAVDRSTITRWVKSGRLPAAGRAGGAYVFYLKDVERFAEDLVKSVPGETP